MAEKKKEDINKLVNFVQNNINKLYKNTYYTQPDNKLDLDTLKSDIDSSIDSIINNNVDNSGISNISRLYSRLKTNKIGDNKVVNEIENLFDDKSLVDGLLMTAYNDNKIIKEQDEEIDLICKYMPQLEDALDAKKDNVLAADHFSKDFINIINTSNINVETTFNERIREIKKKYNLLEFFENIYDRTAKYGEQFIYVVPYSKAISKLIQNKSALNGSVLSESAINEAFNEYTDLLEFDTKTILKENNIITNDDKDNMQMPSKLSVQFNKSGILESAVKNHNRIQKVFRKQSSKTIHDDLSFEGLEGQESIISSDTTKDKKINIKIPGCIVKTIPRENIIPIYIDNLCLGYYCIEHDSDDFFKNKLTNAIDPMNSFRSKGLKDNNDLAKENMLKYLSTELSKNIDAKFINANQDLSKEIYMILKSNDILNNTQSAQLKISYIEPDDIVHMYFEKDHKTNRGVSDLDKALLPAKLYTCLYVTNTVAYLTRGFDKRVYYVKQNVDTNIAQTLLNTINQIKKSNFGARELTNIKSILGMTGRYNDYVIPLSATGDSPIQFEVMQGQNIEVKTELMNQLEQMAINSTDVPYEYVQSRQNVDYAIRLTMSSGKFLRKAFKRQVKVEKFFSEISTRIYNSEYEENDTLEVELPPPAFLNIMNTNQMLQNTNEYVQNIVETEAANESDEFKLAFTKKLKRYYLSTYIDYDKIDKIKDQTRMELKRDMSDSQEQM